MRERLDTLTSDDFRKCFKDWPADDRARPEVQVSICGNRVVEPGEECDCGQDDFDCNDRCCYPAKISASDLWWNDSAVSCSRTARALCVSPPALVYGFYVPLAVIPLVSILVGFFLWRDWRKDKKLFRHITEGNIRIVSG